MSDDNKDITYRGGKLDEEDQAKAKADAQSHEDDVTHVEYRGAEDDLQLKKPKEKKEEHIQYRGAEDDREI